MQSGTPSSALDVRERLRKASAVYHSLVRRVFAVQQLSIPLRLRLFQSLVLSVLLFNSEVWTPTRTHVQWLHTFYLRALRRIVNEPRAPIPGLVRRSDSEILSSLGLPSIDNLLRRRRLLYIYSLTCKPFPALQALLLPQTDKPSSWSQLALRDLFGPPLPCVALRPKGPRGTRVPRHSPRGSGLGGAHRLRPRPLEAPGQGSHGRLRAFSAGPGSRPLAALS